MKKRAFWIASIVFSLTAVVLHWDAMAKANNGIYKETLSGNGDIPEVQRQAFLVEANQFFKAANVLRYAGMAVAVLSIIFLLISKRKSEPALCWPTVIILAFYLLLQLAAV